MPKLIIDGKEIEVQNGLTLIQACEEAGVEIPRFCYHERLSVAGNCRMCLVEVKGMPKPLASCAIGVNDLRPGPNGEPPEILTKSQVVKKAREGVMEFLLINHPLDCPICDQGGECDLQDQAMAYGIDTNRFAENKRSVEDKYIGPLVKTIMTRCIHCTRCVRFSTEVGGIEELGAIGRGEDLEITTYLESAMSSELSGNVIDLCPVGALTSKPYAFAARPWELRKTESIDVMDAVGSNIRVDTRGSEVMRILPRNNDDVNEEWISDKTRFIWDGLRSQRLDQPYIRRDGKLVPASWAEAFEAIAQKVKATDADKIAGLVGDLVSAEDMFAFKDLLTRLGSPHLDCRQDGCEIGINQGGRAKYLFNSKIAGIEEADALLIIGSNPRLEAPVLNARIRKRWRAGKFPIALIGPSAELTYDYEHLGAGPETLVDVVNGPHKFARVLKRAKRPMVIVGMGALSRKEGKAVLASVITLCNNVGALSESWNGFNVLHTAASRVAGLDLNILPGKGGRGTARILSGARKGDIEVLYLLGADEFDCDNLGSAFVIYQGHHGDAGANRADVILPGAAYTEKSGTFVNMEGRVQMARRAAFPPGEAREDWTILRALSAELGVKLDYDTLEDLRVAMYAQVPHLAVIDEIEPSDHSTLLQLIRPVAAMRPNCFINIVSDFYMTNPIARASATMAECSTLRAELGKKGTGTNG